MGKRALAAGVLMTLMLLLHPAPAMAGLGTGGQFAADCLDENHCFTVGGVIEEVPLPQSRGGAVSRLEFECHMAAPTAVAVTITACTVDDRYSAEPMGLPGPAVVAIGASSTYEDVSHRRLCVTGWALYSTGAVDDTWCNDIYVGHEFQNL